MTIDELLKHKNTLLLNSMGMVCDVDGCLTLAAKSVELGQPDNRRTYVLCADHYYELARHLRQLKKEHDHE